MNTIITDIEYIVPVPDKPIGSLAFKVELPVLFKEGQKSLPESEGADVTLSKETVELLDQLGKSIIKDLEK